MNLRRSLLSSLVLAVLAGAPAALADGDPASDILIANDAYYPYAPTTSSKLRSSCDDMLAKTRANGYGLKVAFIESRADLGAYPELFRQPQKYAKLLAAEITYGNRHPHLLVVMPNGFGGIRLPKGWQKTLAKIKIDAAKKSDGLVKAGLSAIPKLAAAGGHPLQ